MMDKDNMQLYGIQRFLITLRVDHPEKTRWWDQFVRYFQRHIIADATIFPLEQTYYQVFQNDKIEKKYTQSQKCFSYQKANQKSNG